MCCETVIEAEQRQLWHDGLISAEDMHRSTLFLDVHKILLHRLKGFFSDYKRMGDFYSDVFLAKWERQIRMEDRVYICLQQHDKHYRQEVAIIVEKIVQADRVDGMIKNLYLTCPHNIQADLTRLRYYLCSFIELLSGDEKFALMVNIQVHFDAGEKPVAFGGSFEADSAIFQQAKKINTKLKREYKEACRTVQHESTPVSKYSSRQISMTAAKK